MTQIVIIINIITNLLLTHAYLQSPVENILSKVQLQLICKTRFVYLQNIFFIIIPSFHYRISQHILAGRTETGNKDGLTYQSIIRCPDRLLFLKNVIENS